VDVDDEREKERAHARVKKVGRRMGKRLEK
jgi:hypothetical protein